MSVYEVIEKIFWECDRQGNCMKCPFGSQKVPFDCNITLLAEQLGGDSPRYWDLKKIKEILDD